MHKFLVTGGAGFIGSNLCEKLLDKGHRVRVLDNMSSGKEENISGFIDSIEFINGDIRDKETVKRAVKGMDYVIHLAALGSVPRSIEDPETYHEVNITGTLNVLNASRESSLKRVVYASSSSIYGDSPVLPKKEDMYPDPRSPYAVSKLAGEYYCGVFHKAYGLETVSLRYFNVYGKRQDPFSQYAAVIPIFIVSLLKDKSPTIYGDGEQTRDFTFVDDCNEANIQACFAKGCAGDFFNIGFGRRITINELFKNIRKKIGKSIEPKYAPARKGDVKDSLSDLSKARKILLYEPNSGIEAGIEKTVEWYRSNFKG